MKKLLLSTTALLALTINVGTAQTNTQVIKPCATYQAQELYIKTIPGYKAKLDAVNMQSAQAFEAYKSNLALQRSTSTNPTSYDYTVPVVFHILHTNGAENIPDADCIAALAQVNKDYARKGADTVNIDPMYEPLYVNSHMKFVLAKKDPEGNCTNGIIHHYDEDSQWKQSDLYAYKYSTVGTYNWKPERYLNIYIVGNIIDDGNTQGIIVGYTHLPGTAPNVGSDAIVYRYNFLGGLNARSLSHEIGHWFGLAHTFGGSNNAGSICGNDDIYDTPATSGFFSTCPLPYTSLNDSCDIGHRPNINNIMDYSSCPMMFTQGQTDKMRFSAEQAAGNRNYLVDTANLVFTGLLKKNVTVTTNTSTGQPDSTITYGPVTPVTCGPTADFYATKAKVCQGQAVVYNSTSFNNTSGITYSWQFEGGAPATSTLAAPSVTYAVPGNYSTTLTVTNASGTSTKIRSPFVNASWHVDPSAFPAMEGFEASPALPAGWNVTNPDYGSLTWTIAEYGAQGSSRSLILPNANNVGITTSGRNVDILETPQYNFSNTSNITVSYDYSYARKTGAAGDVFKFEYSLDCGGTWNTMATTPTSTVMATTTGGAVNAPYVPFSAAKWVNKLYAASGLTALNNKADVKFRFWFQNTPEATAQNLYIDNFNISGTVSLEELENTIGLSIYPNPTSAASTLEFTSPVNAKVIVTVYDVTGRVVENNNFESVAGTLNKYDVNKNSVLKPGIYFVTLNLNNQKITKKLIVQ